MEQASKLIEQVSTRRLEDRLRRKFEKVLLLLLLGELYGLNTLHKIMSSYGVNSNNYQKMWQKISCRNLVGMMNEWLWLLFGEEFEKRLFQSGSTHSRQKLTLVIDGSIFKQWLDGEEFGQYFSKYYSGQYKSTVYGFNVILCGMSIGEVFYPLHFQVRRKTEKDTQVAHRILGKVHKKLEAMAQNKQVKLPQLYLSVDSGFRSIELLELCDKCALIYIGVPKTNHVVYLGDKSLKVKDLKTKFEQKEAAYYQANPTSEEHFTWRVGVYYQSVKQQVTMLLFRLNGSKKVSVIFSPDLDIKAKTMRKHWFERTKIELLFRTIKNDLKIQQSTIRDRLGFMKKFAFALVKALYVQRFTQIVKKTDKSLKRLGFAGIRQFIVFHQIGREYLDELFYS